MGTLARLLILTVMVKKTGYIGAIISRNIAISLRTSAKSLGKDQRLEVINERLLFVVVARQDFSVYLWLSWNSLLDQAGLQLTEIPLPLPPECCD